MKYYKLKKSLPTFDAGELFYTDEEGSLYRASDDMMAYYYKTIKKFPNILKDWFEPAPEPWRDEKTKEWFISYLYNHKDERFFQAVRNFTRSYLNLKGTGVDGSFILASNYPPAVHEDDTFHWECDEMLKEREKEIEIVYFTTTKEPLIKDEKIRKAVRAWAESLGVNKVFVEKPSFEHNRFILSVSGYYEIGFDIDIPENIKPCESYTIEELCGEEDA